MYSKHIDIVCVYNNETLYNQMIESTNNSSDIIINDIGLDNRDRRFESAAAAYNYAISNLCSAEVVIFCHQDIIFQESALVSIYSSCIHDVNTLFGAAGVMNKGKKKYTISAITDPHCKYSSLNVNEIKRVFSLDECLIACNKNILIRVMFDPVTCFAWDFYAVDLCLQCHKKGIRVAVLGMDIQHLSGGRITDSFRKAQQNIREKYKNQFTKISTTCCWFYTRQIFELLHYYYEKTICLMRIFFKKIKICK